MKLRRGSVLAVGLVLAVVGVALFIASAGRNVLHTRSLRIGTFTQSQEVFSLRIPRGRGYELVIGVPPGEVEANWKGTGSIVQEKENSQQFDLSRESSVKGTWLSSEKLDTYILGRSETNFFLDLDARFSPGQMVELQFSWQKLPPRGSGLWLFYLQSAAEAKAR